MKLAMAIDLVPDVPKRWKEQYFYGDKWLTIDDPRGSKKIYEELIAAEPLIAAEANRIIGNTSWTELDCNECGAHADKIIRFGSEPDYDSCTFYVCESCLKAALKAIK